jgi:isopentenyl-diphosphate delta-isomerase
VLLLDADRRILLQRRAAAKTRFPLRWANSCCGHPAPNQPVVAAATIRLREELGVTGVDLREIGIHQYRATDERTGRVEHEYDHVLVGHVAATLLCAPDPAEVAEVRWVQRSDIERDLTVDSQAYAPWLAGVVALLPA